MAKFDQDVYGVGRYGAGQTVPFLADITSGASLPGGPLQVTARCIDKGTVLVSWQLPPQPEFTLLRLVRSAVGPPVDATDGEILLDEPMGSAVEWTDSGLLGARYAYYGVYVFDVLAQVWIRGGFADCIVVDDSFDTGNRLFRLLPAYYQLADNNFGVNNALERFLKVPGFELDILRTEAQSLANTYDPLLSNSATTGLALKQFGIEPEPEVGFAGQRLLLRNLTTLLANKGSAESISGLLAAMTGWGSIITTGINLLADNLDAQFDGSLGHWVGLSGKATYRAGDGQVNAPSGLGVMQLTYTTGTTLSAQLSPTGLTGAPVSAGMRYCGQMLVRGIARTATLTLNWYDIFGNYLSSSTGAGVTTEAVDWNTVVSVFAAAPAGAWWAGLTITVSGISAGDVEYLACAMISQQSTGSTPPPYQPARDMRIVALADLINEIRNPKFGVDISGWSTAGSSGSADLGTTITGFLDTPSSEPGEVSPGLAMSGSALFTDVLVSGATLSRATTDSPPPTQGTCGLLTTTAAAQGMWMNCPGVVQERVYTASCWLKMTGSGSGRFQIVLRDPTNNIVSRSGWTNVAQQLYPSSSLYPSPDLYVPNGWLDLSTSLTAGEDTAGLTVSVVCDGPATAYVGALMLVAGDSSVPYFDGSVSTATADYMWENGADISRTHFYRRRTIRSYRFRELLPRFLPTGTTASLLFAQPTSGIGYGSEPYGAFYYGE